VSTEETRNFNGEQTPTSSQGPATTTETRSRRLSFSGFVLTFLIVAGIWIMIAGKYDLFHSTLGLISCLLVTYLSSDLLFPSPPRGLIRQWARFVAYIPWLVVEIFKAGFHVTYLVFHPRMMDLIDPHIVRFRSKLKSELALLTFANSITLTPGTITVYVSIDGDFKVHAIDRPCGDSLPGTMEEKIAKTFGEE
jgi:multicomponent Na+:H+ antiporter subunit E